MTSRARIKKILNFEPVDRIGIYDSFDGDLKKNWQGQGLSEGVRFEEYFNLDICEYGFNQLDYIHDMDTKFKTASVGYPAEDLHLQEARCNSFSFLEPFGHACYKFGLEKVLSDLAGGSPDLRKFFEESVNETTRALERLIGGGYNFDCVWAYGDLGYKDSAFFSTTMYKKYIYPYHRELFKFISDIGLPIIFHSDGDIKELIPSLIGLGVRSLEPLEVNAGMKIAFLAKEYHKDLVLFGGIRLQALREGLDAFREELRAVLDIVKGRCGYIYKMDGPIDIGISLENYREALKSVAKYGAYHSEDEIEERLYEHKNIK